MVVLDASALIAYLLDEPGAEKVVPHADNACISAINLSEVVARMLREAASPGRVSEFLQHSTLEVEPFGKAEAFATAELISVTKDKGVSLADRACLALGLARKIPVLTADREWKKLKLDLDIRVIR